MTNDFTVHGLRRLELMQMGAPVEAAPWVASLLPFAEETLKLHRSHEADVDVHHLWMTWRPREVVNNALPGLAVGVCWWVAPGQRMRDALEDAAAWHYLMLEQWPARAWTGKMPAGITAGTEIELDMGTAVGSILVVLDVDERVPERCVVVGALPLPGPLPGLGEGGVEKDGGEQ